MRWNEYTIPFRVSESIKREIAAQDLIVLWMRDQGLIVDAPRPECEP